MSLPCPGFVSSDGCNHKVCGLEQQKCIVSRTWRPEVQDQCVGRAVLPLGLWVDPSLPLLAPDGGHLPLCPSASTCITRLYLACHVMLFLCVSVSEFPSSKNTSPTGFGTTLMTSS